MNKFMITVAIIVAGLFSGAVSATQISSTAKETRSAEVQPLPTTDMTCDSDCQSKCYYSCQNCISACMQDEACRRTCKQITDACWSSCGCNNTSSGC
jgi:hypothetical protein